MQRAVLAQQSFDVIALPRDFTRRLIQQLLAHLDVDLELHVFIAQLLRRICMRA